MCWSISVYQIFEEGRVVKLVENADGGHLRWSGYGLRG
jgi:hypothetical protein